jgi:uncharacterized Zn-binding protein involved in type VI secretion
MTDLVMHDGPHCHAPIHPAAPVPTPVPHPCVTHPLTTACVPTVMVNNLMSAVVTSLTIPCLEVPCVPAGPGMVAKGSMTVMIGGLPAARMGDLVAFTSCVAPIPSPTAKILPPCSVNVIVGG